MISKITRLFVNYRNCVTSTFFFNVKTLQYNVIQYNAFISDIRYDIFIF